MPTPPKHSARGAEWFPDVEALIRRLTAEIQPNVTILIKGSRMNRLERVVEALTSIGRLRGPAEEDR